MKTRILRLIASVPVLIAIGSFGWAGQQQTDEERFRKMVENEQATAAPVQEHQRLSALVGKWDMEIKLFPGPGAAPIVLKGACENTMILGGRFLKSEASGTGATPVQSLQVLGFDRRYGKYTFVGYDNGGTYYVTADGVFDKGKNALKLEGQEQDPSKGVQKYDIVLHFVSPARYVSEVIFKREAGGEQGDFKVAEITFTRSGSNGDK